MASIVVDNLSGTVTEDDLREEFSTYGKVTNIRLENGSATIEYDTFKASQVAIGCMNNQELKGRLVHCHLQSTCNPSHAIH
ncbi:RNA recognition motif domain-containing protein [Ditylenchus destructor]|nr:RNA recognition motif domain-containing protein [Ditylenchus destructor]